MLRQRPNVLHKNVLKPLADGRCQRCADGLRQLQTCGILFAFLVKTIGSRLLSSGMCAQTKGSTPLNKNSSHSGTPRLTRRDMLKTTGKAGALLAASSALAP